MNAEQTLAWLESACAALATDPASASEALLSFRRSDGALDAATHALFTPGVVASPLAWHQAAAALQVRTVGSFSQPYSPTVLQH